MTRKLPNWLLRWFVTSGFHLALYGIVWKRLSRAGLSNSRPAGRMRPAKALFVARETLSEIVKIWDKNMLFYSFYSIFLLVTQRLWSYDLTALYKCIIIIIIIETTSFLAFTLEQPHAGAGSDQRWRQTVGLPPSFPLCVCLSVVKRPLATWALWLPRQAATTRLKKITGNSTNEASRPVVVVRHSSLKTKQLVKLIL